MGKLDLVLVPLIRWDFTCMVILSLSGKFLQHQPAEILACGEYILVRMGIEMLRTFILAALVFTREVTTMIAQSLNQRQLLGILIGLILLLVMKLDGGLMW